MFGFFEGVLGEILAPIVPQNQLFLAIQHHRHRETEELLGSNTWDVRKLGDNGVGAVHVACRHNNRHALDLMLQRGKFIFSQLLVFLGGNFRLPFCVGAC